MVIRIAERSLHNEVLLDNDVVIRLDKDGKIIGIEVWDASRRGLKEMGRLLE